MVAASQSPANGNARPILGRLGRHLLLAFLALSLLPLLATNLFGYFASRAAFRDLVQGNLEKDVLIQASGLDDLVAGRVATVAEIAGALALDASLVPGVKVDPLSRALAAALQSSDGLRAFAVFDSSGRHLISQTPGAPDAESCGQAGTGAPVLRARDDGVPMLIVASPIRGTDGGAQGSLCAAFDLSLPGMAGDAITQGGVPVSFYLLGEGGRVLCASCEPDGANPRRELPEFPGILAPAQGELPWSGTVDGNGGPALVAATTVPHAPWTLIAETPLGAASAPIEGLLRQWALFLVVFTVALVGAVGVLVRRLVRPLDDLIRGSRRIGAGRFGEHVPVRGDDELAEVAGAYNRMSDALRESYDRLEARVQERTRELAAAQEFADLVIDAVEHRITVIDRDHRVLRANRAARVRHGKDLSERHCYQVFEGRSAPCEGCQVSKVFETGEVVSFERGNAHEGDVVAVDAFPMPSADGKPRAVVEVARVVTEQKRLQARMMHQEKLAAFGTLAAGLAHEIGNPLSSMSSELQMMTIQSDADSLRESVRLLRDAVARMAGMLRDLTAMSRSRRAPPSPVDTADVVQDVLRMVRHDGRSHNVRVVVNAGRGLPPVRASRDDLVQVLLNLVLNALDAMAGRGALTIRLSQTEEGGLSIDVEDTGPGIDAALRDRVFEAFFTTKPEGRGTGMGLFVTRHLVEEMGGRIAIASEPGRGAIFRVTLPGWQEETREVGLA